jgi:hypothetical protein
LNGLGPLLLLCFFDFLGCLLVDHDDGHLDLFLDRLG